MTQTKKNVLISVGCFIGIVMLSSLLLAMFEETDITQPIAYLRGSIPAFCLSVIALGIGYVLEKRNKRLAHAKAAK